MEGRGDDDNETAVETEPSAEGAGGAPTRLAVIPGIGHAAYGPEVKKKAMGLYYRYTKTKDIAEQLQVPLNTIEYWRKRGNWLQRRDGYNTELAKQIHAKKAFTYSRLASQAVEVIARVINNLATQKEMPSVQDAVEMSKVIKNLDGVMRLAQGLPTNVTEHKGVVGLEAVAMKTRAEIERVIKADPMVTLDHESQLAISKGDDRANRPESLALEARDGELDSEYALDDEAEEQ
jgi:Putative ATPase subunit of terminase (gpP-like)